MMMGLSVMRASCSVLEGSGEAPVSTFRQDALRHPPDFQWPLGTKLELR